MHNGIILWKGKAVRKYIMRRKRLKRAHLLDRMEIPSPVHFKECWVVVLHMYSNFNRKFRKHSARTDLTPSYVASHLRLYCLSLSHAYKGYVTIE